jgi:hypothetical protein
MKRKIIILTLALVAGVLVSFSFTGKTNSTKAAKNPSAAADGNITTEAQSQF